jgi:hypothetical protein
MTKIERNCPFCERKFVQRKKEQIIASEVVALRCICGAIGLFNESLMVVVKDDVVWTGRR